MDADQVLEIVLREMCAIGRGWRQDWIDFDGRTLRAQLDCIADWAQGALGSDCHENFIDGTQFEKDQCPEGIRD